MTSIFNTPRAVPARKWPALVGTAVVLLALPVVLAVDAPIAGWGLAAGLWAANEGLVYLLARLPLGADNLAASGVRGVGMTLRAIVIMVVLLAVAVSNEELALTAALTFVAAYTTELALSLAAYFTGSRA